MSIKAVLFDLDGTLLPMNQDAFIKKYFTEITSYLVKNCGCDPNIFAYAMKKGIDVMIGNDGTKTNESAFWQMFSQVYGEEKTKADYPYFERFYDEKFINAKTECGFSEKSKEIVDYVKSKNLKLALATNPVFPYVATHARIGWAGLKAEDFALITTYENVGYCKPNPAYYVDIAKRIGVEPTECLMVGNDTSDDLSAKKAGMDVFILTPCLINRENIDISTLPHGDFDDLLSYIKKTQG